MCQLVLDAVWIYFHDYWIMIAKIAALVSVLNLLVDVMCAAWSHDSSDVLIPTEHAVTGQLISDNDDQSMGWNFFFSPGLKTVTVRRSVYCDKTCHVAL